VTEETRSAGLTSRRRPVRVRGRRPYPFRGFYRPLSRGGVQAIQEWATQCHGVDTGLLAQLPYSARDGLTGRVGGTRPGYDSQAVSEGWHGDDSPLTQAPAACQSI
jgi:hypothetical protein